MHCVAGTHGAELADDLDTRGIHCIVNKGMDKDTDEYSAFTSTNLAEMLGEGAELYFVGVALDVCVAASVKDAAAIIGSMWDMNFFKFPDITIIEDGCKGLGNDEEVRRTLHETLGVHLVKSTDLI